MKSVHHYILTLGLPMAIPTWSRAELFQVGTKQDIVEAFNAECRKADITRFTIVTKA